MIGAKNVEKMIGAKNVEKMMPTDEISRSVVGRSEVVRGLLRRWISRLIVRVYSRYVLSP